MRAWNIRSPDFLAKDDPATLIVYGSVTEPARVVAELAASADGPVPLAGRYAVLRPGQDDLRFSSAGWMDVTFEQRMALTDPADLFQLCRHRILRNVSLFAKPIREFLDAYLDFVWAQTEIYKDDLEKHGPDGEVFGAADWVFSAGLPLPQARILLPPAFEPGPAQFAEVDIAFWHGGRVQAVVIENSSTPTRSKQRRSDFFRANHPHSDIITIPRDRIAPGQFPADAFPDTFGRYWEGLPLPMGLAPPAL